MGLDLNKTSIVRWFEDVEQHRCGYCKNENGSISNGMWAESLTVEDYQDLIDRGWRRSGKYCYKPIMQETCCPQYTIKCDVTQFSLSKSHKKIIKKFNKFLENGILNKKDIPPEAQYTEGEEKLSMFAKNCPNINLNSIISNSTNAEQVENCDYNLATGEPHLTLNDGGSISEQNICDKTEIGSSHQKSISLKTTFKEGSGPDTSKPPCKKAKILRLERKQEKLLKTGATLKEKQYVQTQKSIEQFLEDVLPNSKNQLRLHLVSTSEPTSEWDRVKMIEFELYKKYQMVVHNDPPGKLSEAGFCRFLVNSPLKITIEQMSINNEHFEVSFKLFQKYQMVIHNESLQENDEIQFDSFLVETPLKHKKFSNGVDGPGYGSFHQQYWLNDKLIAVGVIDILPRCLSSVYFFYDPDYRSLTLGTYGSLREVQFTRSLLGKVPELTNYYMGFYIHSCQKMRYKGQLVPSYLLCPETYSWIPIKRCRELLDNSKYSRLNEDIDAVDENYPEQKDILDIKVLYEFKLMYFRAYKEYCSEASMFSHVGQLIGRKCIKNLVFWVTD